MLLLVARQMSRIIVDPLSIHIHRAAEALWLFTLIGFKPQVGYRSKFLVLIPVGNIDLLRFQTLEATQRRGTVLI